MKKKAIRKPALILSIMLIIFILITVISGCQVLSRFTGNTKTATAAASKTETFTVTRGDLVQSMSTTGSVNSPETKNLSAKITGEVLESVSVGSIVKKGDVLLKIDNSDLLTSIKESKINVEVAEIALKQLQISYKGALDANHIAVQVANLDNESAQKSIDEAQKDIQNTGITGDSSIETARLALEKAQDNFNYSIGQAQISLNKAADQLNATGGNVSTDYNYQGAYLSRDSAIASATNSLDSATAALSDAEEKARINSETAEDAYRQAIISQAKTYWNSLSSLEQAQQKIQSTIESISSSQKQVELAKISLETVSDNLNDNIITAPFDGLVLASAFDKGENAVSNAAAVSVASSDFIIKSSINEADISKAAVGNKVTLSFDAYPDQEFAGEIESISEAPTVSNNVTSYETIIKLTNAEKIKLFYGLTTNLVIVTAEAKNALIVPVQAVYTENGKQYVDVVVADQQASGQGTGKADISKTPPKGTRPNGTFTQQNQSASNSKSTASTAATTKKVEITTGINNYTYYEVLTGLKEGDIVMTSSS
jgi:multidrug efflux pump subunit AcrA (membrane-fusion protein)